MHWNTDHLKHKRKGRLAYIFYLWLFAAIQQFFPILFSYSFWLLPLYQVHYQEIEQLNLIVVVNFATGLRNILKAPHKVTFSKSFLENQ